MSASQAEEDVVSATMKLAVLLPFAAREEFRCAAILVPFSSNAKQWQRQPKQPLNLNYFLS